MALVLRDYQKFATHHVLEAWRNGARSVCLVAPTGSGKRAMMLWFCELAAKNGRRTLFVGNRRLLVTQAADDAKKYGITYGTLMADLFEGEASSPNQIASIQSLESWYFYDKWSNIPTGTGLPPADLIMVDECHSGEKSYAQLIKFYPEAKILGCTATPLGAEGRSLVPKPYDVMVEGAKNSELIQLWKDTGTGLLPTTVLAPSEPWIEGVKIVNHQEYNQKQLGKRVQEVTLFADVFREWEPYQDRATVVFCPGVAYANSLAEQFNSRLGIGQANVVTAKTKLAQRQAIFDSIEDGRSKIITSVDVLREGWDLPVVSCGIDLRPDAQFRSYWQKVGRIKRPYGQQRCAVWLDLAGSYWKYPHPDEDPVWPQGEETSQEAIERTRKATTASKQQVACPRCKVAYTPATRPPRCPSCGYIIEGEPMRRIRMGGGKLVELPAHQKKLHEKSVEQRLYSKWQSALIAGMRSGKTYGQCAYMYRRTTGENPKEHWPFVYDRYSLEWSRRPGDTHTMSTLYPLLKDAAKRIE